jgi:chaperone required for assembly of F1-ATPase
MTEETDEERMIRLSRDRYERPLPKRFYKTVAVSDDNGILLDGRAVKTPMKAMLNLPTRALAEAVAVEWRAQDTHINPGAMPLTKYANTAIDRAVSERDPVLDDFANYVRSDLVCYRADKPPGLVNLQALHWDAVLDDVARTYGAQLVKTVGVMPVAQPESAVARLRAAAAVHDIFRLTSLYNLTTLLGSACLALMLVEGRASPEQGWFAAHVDEDFQIAAWGADDEAMARRARRRLDFDALIRLLSLL